MAFGVLAGQITVIFLEVLLGYVGARSGIIKDRDSKFLSDFIMKLLLPCTMLAGAAVEGEPELLTQAGILFVLLLLLFVATTALCRVSSWLHHDTPGKYAVLVGTAAMPNCGFIGLPLCSALLGAARGTVFAGMAMASYNVWFFTYVVCLFRPGEKIRLKTFITPTNIATVAMLVLLATGWRLPAPVQQFCSAVGGCTTPLALMIVGVLLADSDIRALPSEQSRIIRLSIAGFKGAEIARRLGISINTVKTQKYRGYRSLRLKLSKFVFLFGSLLALFADLK